MWRLLAPGCIINSFEFGRQSQRLGRVGCGGICFGFGSMAAGSGGWALVAASAGGWGGCGAAWAGAAGGIRGALCGGDAGRELAKGAGCSGVLEVLGQVDASGSAMILVLCGEEEGL